MRDYFHPSQVTPEPEGRLLVACAVKSTSSQSAPSRRNRAVSRDRGQVEVLAPAYWRDILREEFKKSMASYET